MATLKDVAKASDVSAATVSNVLTGKAIVHPRTRKRVMQAIRDLNYRPNAVARGLTQKRMNTLGVVFPHADVSLQTNPFFGSLLEGILSVATRAEQNTTLYTILSWYEEKGVLGRVCDGRCDGTLLLVPPDDTRLVPALLETNTPCVLVSSHSDSPVVSSVDVDNYAGAYAVVRHLLERGHRRIAFAFSPDDCQYHFGRQRMAGGQAALASYGVEWNTTQSVDSRAFAEFILCWKANPADRPTAVFCFYDLYALDLIERLSAHGLRVPEDIAVAGFDDILAASVSTPPLTTVRQQIVRLGECAAELLLAQINGEKEPGTKKILPAELVVRQSTDFHRLS